jgi:ABC-2 type transport system ATP-binding protein
VIKFSLRESSWEYLKARSRVGAIIETPAFYENFSARRNLQLLASLSGGVASKPVEEVLEIVDLRDRAGDPVKVFSYGMRQRLGIAQALLPTPDLIILDEPTNGLDPPARLRMIKLIREIRDSGQAHIVLSSHLLLDVEECCDEILILRDGKIAVYCNLEEERKSNRKFLMLETRGDHIKFVEAISKLGCEYALTGDHRLKLVLQEGVDVRDLYRLAAQEKVQIRRLSYKRDSLEDIFLKAMENGDGGL